jgi:hypothetical protein
MMAAAGLLCSASILLCSYIGYTIGSGKGWQRQLELAGSGLIIVIFMGLLLSAVYSTRFWAFVLMEAGSSYFFAARGRIRREKGTQLAPSVIHPEHIYVVAYAYPLFGALAFAFWLYPTLPRNIGGAMPHRVNVVWASDVLAREFAGKELYNVFDDAGTVYLASDKRITDIWLQRLLPAEDSLDYHSVPRSAILAMHYLPANPFGLKHASGLPNAGKDAGSDLGQAQDAGTSIHGDAGHPGSLEASQSDGEAPRTLLPDASVEASNSDAGIGPKMP